jgi:hypothetical protein
MLSTSHRRARILEICGPCVGASVIKPLIIEVQVVELIAVGIRAMSGVYITRCICIPMATPGSNGRGFSNFHLRSPILRFVGTPMRPTVAASERMGGALRRIGDGLEERGPPV